MSPRRGLASAGARANRRNPACVRHQQQHPFVDNTNKPCRNCGAGEFYSKDVSLWGDLGALLPAGFLIPRDVHLRVCGNCGLLDWFVAPSTLAKVKEKFTKDP